MSFTKGSGAKEWGNVCNGCPREAQQAVGICDKQGCIRFFSHFDQIRQKMFFSMECTHCKMRTTVHAEDGFKCSTCGLSCGKAHQAHLVSGESRAMKALSGPILDEVGPVLAEEFDDED